MPASDPVVERLPTLLREKLGDAYPTSGELSIAGGPPRFRRRRRADRYQPRVQLTGPQAAIFVGDSMAALRLYGPYPGWDALRARINSLLDVLQESRLAIAVERISLRFVNVLREHPERQLDALNVRIELAGEAAPERGFHLRAELNDEVYERVIEIQPGATGPAHEVDRRETHGLMLELDCRRRFATDDFWPQRSTLIEDLHFEMRALFFRLLTPESIAQLGPIYRAEPEHG